MFDPPDVSTFSLWALILSVAVLLHRNSKRRYPLPPGPTPIPVIGNLLPALTRTPWVTYAAWSQRYNSELVSFTVFGQVYIVVNSLRAAKELFESRSAMYSSRPYMTMIDMAGWYFNMALLPYGNAWRARRRMLHLHFAAGRASAYYPLQMEKRDELIRRLYEDPDGFLTHLRLSSTSLAMDVAYGHVPASQDDPFVALADKAVASFAEVTLPGASALINTFPFLRHLPSWLPGMGFKTRAEQSRQAISDLLNVPWERVEQQVADGTARPSLASSWIVQHKDSHPGDDAERVAKDGCTILYVAGGDATVASFTNAMRALALNPSMQVNAQAEIDNVIGRSRLPTFDDRPSLSYVGAVVREVMRTHQAFPLSALRVADKDDIYIGMTIPKGAHIIPNLWAISNNPDVYAEPDVFKPERFLTGEGNLNSDPSSTLFGFGRRNCVGQHFAEATVWIMVTSIIAVYTISKAKDASGNEIPIEVAASTGGISQPCPFRCSIKPRDAAAEALLKLLPGNPA